MNATEILSLLEKPTRDRRKFVYQIRDEAAVADIVAALRASATPQTRNMLCYILNLRTGAEWFEGKTAETRQAVPALIEALADEDVRIEAIDALGHIGDPVAGPALLQEYLRDDNAGVRACLASALGACHYAPAIPILIEALSSPHDQLRHQAAVGLRQLHAREAIEPLRKALAQERDPFTQKMMQETLEELENPATDEEKIERLIAQLKNAHTVDEREAAANALGDMDRRVLPSLLALLRDEQSEVRRSATLAISALSEHRDADWFVWAYREQVQGPLIQALADLENSVRAAAAQALGRWGDERAVEPLLAAMQDSDVEVRREVVAALRYSKDERTLEPLLNAFFSDEDLQVRSYAAQELGRHQEDSRAVDALIQALQDEGVHMRRQAAELLCWLEDERAIDALLQSVQDEDAEVREWSIEAIWQLCTGKGDEVSAEAIEKMRKAINEALQDENSGVRECAQKIAAWIDG